MAGYIVVQVDVTDPDAYAEYVKLVPPTVEKHGGEFLVRGGAMEILEGEWPMKRLVVVRFPSVAAAKAWHADPDYAKPKAMRQAASRGNMVVVEGA